MTSWNRRLNAATTRPASAGSPTADGELDESQVALLAEARRASGGRPGGRASSIATDDPNGALLAPKPPKPARAPKVSRTEVLAEALAAGVVEEDLTALFAMANIARSRPGFRSSIQVKARHGNDVRTRDYEVLFAPDGPIVREALDGAPVFACAGDGPADDLDRVLARTLATSPDLVGIFPMAGHGGTWLNDSLAAWAEAFAPGRPIDQLRLTDLLDEASVLRYEREVLPALTAGTVWQGGLGVRRGDHSAPVSAVAVAHRHGDVAHLAVVARPLDRGAEDLVRHAGPVPPAADQLSLIDDAVATDHLTGLPSRSAVLEILTRTMVSADHRSLVTLLVDVDHMRAVNEAFGEEVGDDVLRRCAERMLDAVGTDGIVGRLGSDEFAVVLPGVGAGDGLVYAIRLRDALSVPMALPGGDHVLTISVGMAVVPTGEELDAESILRNAERAVLQAKASGRDRIEVYTEELAAVEVRRLTAGQTLRRALDEDDVVVHYQPIVDLASDDMVSAEALLRVHGDEDLLSPADYVEAAESSGLIARLGAHVLDLTCRQLAEWRGDGLATGRLPHQISVNVSPRQLADPELPMHVLAALEASAIEPGQLWLEITESTLIGAQDTIDEGIRYLRDLGVRIGLDDFGAGQSSLAYLKRFPLDFVKIHRSLVAGLGDEERDTAIVRATVELAHNLGMTVVAVGVESGEQLDLLRELGCDRAQGHHFAPALSPADLRSRLAD